PGRPRHAPPRGFHSNAPPTLRPRLELMPGVTHAPSTLEPMARVLRPREPMRRRSLLHQAATRAAWASLPTGRPLPWRKQTRPTPRALLGVGHAASRSARRFARGTESSAHWVALRGTGSALGLGQTDLVYVAAERNP